MNPRLEISKLAQLRAKTNRQLVQVINKQLDAGLHAARQASEVSRAEQARAEAGRLLLFLPGAERRGLEVKLARLDAEIGSRLRVRVLTAC